MCRVTKLQNLMDIAEVVSRRSHDAETQVGALLINNDSGAILATGFNGFVRSANDGILPNTRPNKNIYVVHAEENILYNCCRHGISTNNCKIICTQSPCSRCMRAIYQAGIKEVIAKHKYRDYETLLTMKDIKIIESVTEEGFYKLKYEV